MWQEAALKTLWRVCSWRHKRYNEGEKGGAAMKRLRWMLTLGMVALALAFVACGGGNGDSPSATDGDADDAQDADEHDPAAEANAYLEVAPKDALFLVEMTSFAFAPDVLEVNAGDVLEIAIQNVEPVLHDFTIDKIDADVHVSFLGGTGEHAHTDAQVDADVHFALTEAGTGAVHLKIEEPGDYVFYCTVPGHQEAGMEGTLTVLGE